MHEYQLIREDGDLDTDIYAYDHCLAKRISHLDANVQSIWSYSFSEIINNVMDHLDASDVKIFIKQDYLNTSVMVADNGIGIF